MCRVMVLVMVLCSVSGVQAGNLLQMVFAWEIGEKLFLVNHELGHCDEVGLSHEVEFDWSLFRSSGKTTCPSLVTWEHEVKVANAGFRASKRLFHSSLFALEQGLNKFEQRMVAFMALTACLDFPIYTVGDGWKDYTNRGSDIVHLERLLHKPRTHFQKQAAVCVVLNVVNIVDLSKAALGKGYRKRKTRIWGMSTGDTLWAGATLTF